MLIVVEGIDGAGKSSVIVKIKEFIEENTSKEVFVFKFPSDNETGKNIREEIARGAKDNIKFNDLLVEDFNYTIMTQIIPLLNDKKIVICDRYIMSFLAYQITESCIEDVPELRKIHSIPAKLIILLDIDPTISLKRITGKKDAIEKRGIKYFNKVRETFLRLANLYTSEDKMKVIDASKDQEKVTKDVLKEVKNLCDKYKLID